MATQFQLEGQPQQLMIFEVTANGQPARMILDTGAGTVLFGESAAAKLGISVSGEIVPGHGAGGPLELKIAELSDLSIDGKQFQNLPILISDQVEIVTAHIGLSLEGVAGYPLFSGSTLQIDFENSQFSLT